MDGTGLKKKDLKRFREILLAEKKEILRNAQRTLNEDMSGRRDCHTRWTWHRRSTCTRSPSACAGCGEKLLQKNQSRAREDKGRHLRRCKQCSEPISLKRLEARLETTLCIRCKEDQERIEKAYSSFWP